MKLIKTESRNRLNSESMSDLMTVQMMTGEIGAFDPTAAIHVWNAKSRRRTTFHRKRRENSLAEQNEIEEQSCTQMDPDDELDSSSSMSDYDLSEAVLDI